MERSEYQAIESHMGVLLLHLIKWEFQPQQRSSSWRGSIHNAHRSIAKRLKESPSLRARLAEARTEESADTRYNASNETGLPENAFPADCPYSVEEALDADGLDYKSAQGRPVHVSLRAQNHVLQEKGDAGTEQDGRNYDQGRCRFLTRRRLISPLVIDTRPETKNESRHRGRFFW